jgi:hypothetical protein
MHDHHAWLAPVARLWGPARALHIKPQEVTNLHDPGLELLEGGIEEVDHVVAVILKQDLAPCELPELPPRVRSGGFSLSVLGENEIKPTTLKVPNSLRVQSQ